MTALVLRACVVGAAVLLLGAVAASRRHPAAMTDWDYRPAVDRLIDGGSPPPESWGGPPRPLPPRPLPRHLTNPTPHRRWGTDLRTVTRHQGVRPALGRIVAAVRRTPA